MEEIRLWLDTLEREIKRKDKKAIIHCYDELQKVNWDEQSDMLFEEYDELINRANEILIG